MAGAEGFSEVAVFDGGPRDGMHARVYGEPDCVEMCAPAPGIFESSFFGVASVDAPAVSAPARRAAALYVRIPKAQRELPRGVDTLFRFAGWR